MTADEVYASVLRFLDQFISRGADPDVIELRARLVSDEEVRGLLDAQLPSSNVSVREGFDAMRTFFEAVWEASGEPRPEGSPALNDLIFLDELGATARQRAAYRRSGSMARLAGVRR